MTQFLLRHFVANYEHTDEPAVRAAYGRLSGWVGIVCNILLFAAKFLIGIISGSVSITADAVNNLSDASGSLVTLLGFHLASKPADDEHPYGHERIEYLSGLGVAVLILLIGVELIKSSVGKILHPEAVSLSVPLVIVLVLSILGKLWLSGFFAKLAGKLHSVTLKASAADCRNDVISTAAVLLACVIGHFANVTLDGYIGLLVALFILWSGIGAIKDTIDPLLGAAPDEELVHTLAHTITAHEKVLGVHDLIVHDYGLGRRFASVHVEMDANEDVLCAHELIDDIEREVREALRVELVIHYDPIVTDDEELNTIRQIITDHLACIDARLAFHDLRMVRGVGHTNIIFDMVVPFDLREKAPLIGKSLEAALPQGTMRYYAVINYDFEAFNDPHTR